MINATLTGGIVTVQGRPLTDVIILCEGTSLIPVEGAILQHKGQCYFVANTQPDLKTLIELFSQALTAISSTAVPVAPGAIANALNPIKALAEQLKITLI